MSFVTTGARDGAAVDSPRPCCRGVPPTTPAPTPTREPRSIPRPVRADSERATHDHSRLPAADDAARQTDPLSSIANRLRQRPIYALDVAEELCVGALTPALDISEDSVPYAVRLLRAAGLLVSYAQGRFASHRPADDFPAPLREQRLRQLIALTRTVVGDESGACDGTA